MSQVRVPSFGACIIIGALLAGCAGGGAPVTTESERAAIMAGWYSQNATAAVFQPCGSPPLSIPASAALRQRARDFDLQDDLPVYVRLRGIHSGTTFKVASIEQFGSATPIRDCPMSGTTIQH